MVKARPAAGGGRWVEISPERLKGWLDGFYGRHDGATEDARGAAAVGVAAGTTLETSKVERFYVQGRTAAGGWSQQRYARRRGNQTDAAVEDAADIAARVLAGHTDLASVVCGGDRAMLDLVLEDPRLDRIAALRHPHLLEVPEPRLNVLEDPAVTARKIRIHLVPSNLTATLSWLASLRGWSVDA